jgi:RHS repeat-associated protein
MIASARQNGKPGNSSSCRFKRVDRCRCGAADSLRRARRSQVFGWASRAWRSPISATGLRAATHGCTPVVVLPDGRIDRARSAHQHDHNHHVVAALDGRTHVCAPIDANGNLTSDGTRSFEWDARNQLVSITAGSSDYDFQYDGMGLVSRILAQSGGIPIWDYAHVNCDDQPCEERVPSTAAVTRRVWSAGESINGAAQFLSRDHLRTVRRATDVAGSVQASYDVDPWGRRELTGGGGGSDVGFTGHRTLPVGDLWQAPNRIYSSDLAQWLSDDPAQFIDGLNRRAYGRNNPVKFIDPQGLAVVNASKCIVFAKDEKSGLAFPIYPGQTWDGPQDGIAVPENRQGSVYKTPGRFGVTMDVVVSEGGSVSASGPLSWLMGLGGGWKDRSWHNDLRTKGDTGWDQLFHASERKPECCK